MIKVQIIIEDVDSGIKTIGKLEMDPLDRLAYGMVVEVEAIGNAYKLLNRELDEEKLKNN
jgi:hypothetical protein